MIISQPAFLCISAIWRHAVGRASAHRESAPGQINQFPADSVTIASATKETSGNERADTELQRNLIEKTSAPRLISDGDRTAPLTANERRARAAALRGLALSRGRQFEAARIAFVEASRLDPELDLTRTPSFWLLERAAHEAAIDAYVKTGRDGDAAVLRAQVRSTYRPKPVRSRAGASVIS